MNTEIRMKNGLRQRGKISGTMSVADIISEMSEGNPGAINVMCMLVKSDKLGVLHLLALDDMNIWGPQIWVGFKDHCNQDLDLFIKCLEDRDPAMVRTINANFHEAIAVMQGASYRREQ